VVLLPEESLLQEVTKELEVTKRKRMKRTAMTVSFKHLSVSLCLYLSPDFSYDDDDTSRHVRDVTP